MKMKTQFIFYPLTLIAALLILTCTREQEPAQYSFVPIEFNPDLTYGTITDQEGNTYKTITIGTQTWMAENLKVTKYRNGDPIPNLDASEDWDELTTGACCYFNNESIFFNIYGMLYNWYAINDSRNIAPSGWHVPTFDEWTTLVDFLGGEESSRFRLMEQGSYHWSPPTHGKNDSGFTALAAGALKTDSIRNGFCCIASEAYFWSSDDDSTNSAWNLSIKPSYDIKVFYTNKKTFAFSVRCIKDD